MDPRPGLFVRVPNWLGDLVLAWPILEAADARGAIFAGPAAFAALLEPRFPKSRYWPTSRSQRFALVRALRAARARPEVALLLTESFSSALVAALAGIPRRIGYAADGRGALLTTRVPRAGVPRSTPRTAEYRRLAEAAGLTVGTGPPALAGTPAERAAGRAALGAAGIDPDHYAVLAPGAAYGPAKQWGPERFAAVGAHLARSRGLALAIVGTVGDAEVAAATARIAVAAGARAVSRAGATTLTELVGILAGAAAVVSNDSGPMHLAAALGRPTLAIFGSTSPVWTSASAPSVANLYAEYPCSPCFRRTCPIGYGCLQSIAAEDGVEALERVLRAEGERVALSGGGACS